MGAKKGKMINCAGDLIGGGAVMVQIIHLTINAANVVRQTTGVVVAVLKRSLQNKCQAYGKVLCMLQLITKHLGLFHISENSRKLYVANLVVDVHCNFTPEALMNTLSSYEAAYWLE